MAIIVPIPGAWKKRAHLHGSVVLWTQGEWALRRKAGPCNRQTTPIMQNRTRLPLMHKNFDALTDPQKTGFSDWAWNNFIGDGIADRLDLHARMGYATSQLPALIAGDPPLITPTINPGFPGVNFTNCQLIDKDTIRLTFNPSPAGANFRIHLKQTLPGPGAKNPHIRDAYICGISALNAVSPQDFTTHNQHLAGWSARYYAITQHKEGPYSDPTTFDL